jgi:predicted peptidase
MTEDAVAYQEMECGSLRCLVSIPPGEPPEGGWPILIFLHGSQEAAPRDLQAAMKAHGPLAKSSGSQATRRFVVIAPQLPAPGGCVWHEHDHRVQQIALSAVDTYQGNRSKIYLTGFSYGGMGVLDIGSLRPNVWAALWPVDPVRGPAGTLAPPENMTARPIWVSVGERSRGSASLFRRVQAPYVYEDRGLPHVPTAAAAYGDGAIYDWLLAHRTP